MTPTPTSADLFKQFCEAFGEHEAVQIEIVEFWNANGSFSPIEVYNHLIEKRVTSRDITRLRADFLKAYFAESFQPEHTTGYLDKHRAPLIDAFAEAYAEHQKDRPIFRVEADIMNLGGLNKALDKAYRKSHEQEARAVADRVIGVMTNILRSHLTPLGYIAPIRRGGDELTIYVQPSKKIGQPGLQEAITAAENEMARFINEAGLRELPHLKADKEPGVGIGCAVSSLCDEGGNLLSDVAISKKLDHGIKAAKEEFQKLLGKVQYSVPAKAGSQLIIREKIDSALRTFYSHSKPNSLGKRFLNNDDNFTGNTPKEARLLRAQRNFPVIEGTDSVAEARLLMATVDLTDRVDFVTGLPQFGAIERTIVPNFMAQPECTGKARVVHIDFNNMGGGNRLGPWVGDAMARVFAACVTEAMKANGIERYLPYLTSQGGGKFTLLLPALPQYEGDFAEKLTVSIEQDLTKRSHERLLSNVSQSEINAAPNDAAKNALRLQQEQFAASADLIREAGKSEVKKRAGGVRGGEKTRPILINPEFITLKDINNTKSRRQGSHVVALSTVVDLTNSGAVTQAVRKLEHMTRGGQDSIEPFDHRRAEKRKNKLGQTITTTETSEKVVRPDGDVKQHRSHAGEELARRAMKLVDKPR